MPSFNQSRQTVIQLIILIFFIILVARLMVLQLFSPEYQLQAMDNAVDRVTIYPVRGLIFDRKNRPIIQNSLTRDLMVSPTQLKGIDTLGFCKLMGIDINQFKERIVAGIIKNGRNRPSVFESSISLEKYVKIQENMYRFEPAFYLQDRSIRTYPYDAAAHVLGYLGEVDSNILKKSKEYYQLGDYMGLTGLERSYERVLIGQRGIKYLIKDNKNRIVGSYNNGMFDTSASPGLNLRTTLDIDVQVLAEKFLSNKLGAVVAINPQTGGIIAMASGPTYNPNLLTGSERRRNFSFLLTDTARPLFNRAIKGQYPPGSTFKPVGALIALSEGVITPEFGFPCFGAYYNCNRPIKCTHSGGSHASSLRNALAFSCNSYFSHIYRLAVDNPLYGSTSKGYSAWKSYMNNFGMGVKLGVDLPSEDKGYVADVSFYNSLYKNQWNSCTNVFLGIGQGEMLATPLQMANLMCMIGNKGFFYTPHFVQKIDGNTNQDTTLSAFKVKHTLNNISQDMYEVVKLGMQDVVNYGTARVAQIPGIQVCGKTGTAENWGFVNGKREKFDDHSWFVCFAPKENPVIAVAVIIENGGYGATWGGPIARMIMEKYINDSLSNNSKLDSARIAAKEIILPVVKRKRILLDSLRKVKKAMESTIAPYMNNKVNTVPSLLKNKDTSKQKTNIPQNTIPKSPDLPPLKPGNTQKIDKTDHIFEKRLVDKLNPFNSTIC